MESSGECNTLMITHRELIDRTDRWGLTEAMIEKDYVLGWILWAISKNEYLANHFCFKGGTCLKKCYFPTWRFSEDIDFTVLPQDTIIDEDSVRRNLLVALDMVNDVSGINCMVDPLMLKRKKFPFYLEGRIHYRGPRNARIPGSIKIDLLSAEKIVLPSVLRPIDHRYSDILPKGTSIRCYDLTEIFAEKIHALGTRVLPRDLYDVVHLYKHMSLNKQVYDVIGEKCKYKNINVPTFKSMSASPFFGELTTEWENMLGNQLVTLPSREEYLEEVKIIFKHIEQLGMS